MWCTPFNRFSAVSFNSLKIKAIYRIIKNTQNRVSIFIYDRKIYFLHKILQKVGNHQISTIINEFSMFFLKICNNAFSVFSEHSNKIYAFDPYYRLTLKDTTQFENNHGLSCSSPLSKTLFKVFRPNYAPIVIGISVNREIYKISRPKLHLKNKLVKYFQCKISK